MKTLVVFALAVVFLSVPASADSALTGAAGPSYEWMKVFEPGEEQIGPVWQLSDGSYVTGGSGENGRILIGIDEKGEISWKKEIPGGDENGTVRFVQEAPGGGLYIFTDGENLMKTTSSGDLLWTYHQPMGVISSIEVTDSGSVMMAGNYYQSFLTMVGENGTEMWNKSLGSPQGGGQYKLSSVQGTPDGGFIVAGYINPIMYTENYLGFAMKTDADGNQEWARQYLYDDSVIITTITPLKNGGYAAGLVEMKDPEIPLGEGDAEYISYVLILDSRGDEISKNRVQGADLIYHIKTADDGGFFILAEVFDSLADGTEYRVIRTDADCSPLWTKSFENVRISSIQKTQDGGILIGGTDEETGEGLVIKMEPHAAEEAKTPGFGGMISLSALILAFLVFCFKRAEI